MMPSSARFAVGCWMEKKEEGHTYPDVVSGVRKTTVLYPIFSFAFIVIASVCIALNVWLTPTLRWGEIVACSLAYLLWLGYIILKDNAGYRIRILSGVAGAVLLIILIDTFLGFSGWSVSYVLPAAIILLDLALAILMLINRRNWQSYLILQVAMVLVGIVPLVLDPYRYRDPAAGFGYCLFGYGFHVFGINDPGRTYCQNRDETQVSYIVKNHPIEVL